MLVTLDSECCGYTITPVNRRFARKLRAATGHDSLLYQLDWDFPHLARMLGWRGLVDRRHCDHRSTDGTVTCTECGTTAGEFINAASNWLETHCGQNIRIDEEVFSRHV